MIRFFAALVFAALVAAHPASAAEGPFKDWTAVVVAGDWRATSGAPTEAFDNARRDVTKAVLRAGFTPANVLQFSLRPQRPGDDPRIVTTPQTFTERFAEAAGRGDKGCLFYLTSHGSPAGAVFGPVHTLRPDMLKVILDGVCGTRPTVVVISACFSGVFVPMLAERNRLILTAARPDRSSFGCGEDDVYPVFDECVLTEWPGSHDFLALARHVQACVAREETRRRFSPPSEPQLYVGPDMQLSLPMMRFPPG